MLSRRHTLQLGLAAIGSTIATAGAARAQSKPTVKIRYSEVVHSVLYAPTYVAMAKGFFAAAGLEVVMTTANGGDKAMAALIGGEADIALMGPESAIYVLRSESPTKVRVFCGLTATDGFMLVGRKKIEKFDWTTLKGEDVLGFRPGSTPLLFLEEAMRQNGIDPNKDVKLNNNVGIPARVGSWLGGQNRYGIFIEPDASQLELDGKAYFLASIGQTVGFADYTAFMATDQYIHDNPGVLQSWTNAIYQAQQWTATAPAAEMAKLLAPYFPGVAMPALTAAAERYRRLRIWKTSPAIEPAAIAKFQDILVRGNVLDPAKRVTFSALVVSTFATKAT